jgi:hypothetical protein
VPARLVECAVKQVLKSVKSEHLAPAAELPVDRQRRHRLRQSVRTGFQELLTLLWGTAQRAVLIAKREAVEHAFETEKTKT